jgi:hypothetical protein
VGKGEEGVAWVRVEDHFDEHPKFQKVGPLAAGLWLAGLAYCNRNLTDGFIPEARVRAMVTWHDDTKEGYEAIDRLVQAGLWERMEDGYLVHDFRKYQPLKKQVLAERSRSQAAKSLGGRVRASRAGRDHGRFTSRPPADAPAAPPADAPATTSPVPVPVPVPKPDTVPLPQTATGLSITPLGNADKDTVPAPRSRFTPPSLAEVAAYCLERGRGVDPARWMDHYESNGWRVGRNPMKSWKAAVRKWEGSEYDKGRGGGFARSKGAVLIQVAEHMKAGGGT